jgi:hypothetical protein
MEIICKVPDSSFNVSGSMFLVPGIWFIVPGFWLEKHPSPLTSDLDGISEQLFFICRVLLPFDMPEQHQEVESY